MGFNATVVVYVDALDAIERDEEFGRKLKRAIVETGLMGKRTDVPAGCHVNAAMVVESHHADRTAVITVGGNLGVCHLEAGGWSHHEVDSQKKLVRAWAEKLGLEVRERK